jgi:hypothetical protein
MFLLQDQDGYMRQRLIKLLCKNRVQGAKFCGQTAPAIKKPAASTTIVANVAAVVPAATAAKYYPVQARELGEEEEEKGVVRTVGPVVTHSAAVQQLFSGLPRKMGATPCDLRVICPRV